MVLTKKRIITAIVLLLLVAGLALGGYLLYRNTYSATLDLYFAPRSASVKIGDGGGRFGVNYLKPGTYKVTIAKKGFATYTNEVTLKAGEVVGVEASLASTSPDTANWYRDNLSDYEIAQTIGDRKADRDMERFKKQFPVAKDLPIVGLYNSYRVDYGPSPTVSGEYALFIRYQSEPAKQEAIAALKAKGYDAADYEVIYESTAPTQGTVSFPGIAALTKRGMSASVLRTTQRVLSEKYASTSPVSLSFAETANHIVKEDGALHTYAGTFTVNGGAQQQLTVDVRDMTMVVIRVGSETLYSGII